MKSERLVGAAFLLGIVVVACGGSTADPLLGSAPDGGSESVNGNGSSGGGSNTSPDCSRVKCAGCPAGEQSVSPAKAGRCCACEPIPPGGSNQCLGDALPCADLPCDQGMKPKGNDIVDGPGCCSKCEPDAAYCSTKRSAFDTWLENRLAQPGALDCQVKDDCENINPSNKCQGSCGIAVAKKQSSTIRNEARTFGEQNCKNCPDPNVSCPAVFLTPRCNVNTKKCELGLGG